MENTNEFWKKWAGLIGLVLALVVIALVIFVSSASRKQNASSAQTPTASTSVAQVSANPAYKATLVSANATYQNPSWSLKFTVRPEWNVQEIPDASGKLHQFQLSASTIVIFISKIEAIGLSDDLAYTTSARTIAGQQVSVKTYIHPNAQFTRYELFTLSEPDGKYSFLIKDATSDTTHSDAFINSISVK